MKRIQTLNLCIFVLSSITISTHANPIASNKESQSVDSSKNVSLSNDSASSILKFMTENSAKIQFTRQKDIVLMLGNTGAGKSTLTSFLTGAELESIETLKDSGEFVFVDKNDLISRKSTTISKTVVPNLMIDKESGLTFYDCPGFSDSRGVVNDISVSYLIKKLINRAEAVKLVFAVSFSSVRNGGDRRNFLELLNHATNFVKDIQNYKNGIALIVTKVDNRYINKNETLRLVDDDKIIETIALFLKQVKIDLENKYRDNVSVEERELNNDKIKFIEILLQKDKQNKYTRIGIFRLADQAGTVTNMPLLQNERNAIISMIEHNLRYVVKRNDDFGYAISDETKHQIHDLMKDMQKRLTDDVYIIGDEIKQFYLQQEEHTSKIETLKQNAYRELSQLKTTKFKSFAAELNGVLHDLGIKISIENLNRLRHDIEAVDFLKITSNISLDDSFHISNGLAHTLDFLETVCIHFFV